MSVFAEKSPTPMLILMATKESVCRFDVYKPIRIPVMNWLTLCALCYAAFAICYFAIPAAVPAKVPLVVLPVYVPAPAPLNVMGLV